MAFISQFYSWSTGNTITAARLNGNVTNITDGLSDGSKDINVANVQIGGTTRLASDGTAALAGLTLTGAINSTSASIAYTVVDNNASAFSIDTDGKSGLFVVVTTNGAEGITMSGTLSVTGASTLTGTVNIGGTIDLGTNTIADGTFTGDWDYGTGNITTGGIIKLDVDGTAENTAGSLTLGAGNDAGIFFDGTDLVIITNGAGASGIKLDSEDDTVEILGSGVLQATFDTGGLNLVTGDEYSINSTSVLNETTLGSGVVTSSLTTVGALDSGSITSGFGAIDNGTSNITTGGIIKLDVDGTAENAAGSLTLGAGNDAGIFFDGTDLVIISNGAGAGGIKLDSEDDTVEILGSGVTQATFDATGLNLVSGDAYYINSTSVLNATTLGSGVVTSSLTTVGALNSGSISTGFGNIDVGSSTITADTLTADSNVFVSFTDNTVHADPVNFQGVQILNASTTDNTGSQLLFGNQGTSFCGILGLNDTGDSSYMQFYTESSSVRAVRMTLASNGRFGIGSSSPSARLHVDQTSSAGAIPVLYLDQGDASEPFIDYVGTSAANASNSISTWTTGNSIQGFIQIDINGTQYWMPYYDAPTS